MSKFHILPIHPLSCLKVGIMGGSFNPAHEGHRYISIQALKRFSLDWVIWFVTPYNPLKSRSQYADLKDRVQAATKVARHPRIIVSDFEKYLPNTYTITLLRQVKLMYPNVEFSYIMGADNAIQLNKWKHWQEIPALMPIIIFDREHYHRRFIGSKLNASFGGGLIQPYYTDQLSLHPWYFVKLRRNFQSSTKIRHEQQHNNR